MQVGEMKSHRQVDTQQLLCLWLTFNSNRGWEIPQKKHHTVTEIRMKLGTGNLW